MAPIELAVTPIRPRATPSMYANVSTPTTSNTSLERFRSWSERQTEKFRPQGVFLLDILGASDGPGFSGVHPENHVSSSCTVTAWSLTA